MSSTRSNGEQANDNSNKVLADLTVLTIDRVRDAINPLVEAMTEYTFKKLADDNRLLDKELFRRQMRERIIVSVMAGVVSDHVVAAEDNSVDTLMRVTENLLIILDYTTAVAYGLKMTAAFGKNSIRGSSDALEEYENLLKLAGEAKEDFDALTKR